MSETVPNGDEDGGIPVLSLIRNDGTARVSPSVGMVPEVIRILRDDMPTQVARALADLATALPEHYETPCRQDPGAFDAPQCPNNGGAGFRAIVERVRRAMDACLDCKVFVHCMKVAAANRVEPRPPILGVLAGELHGSSPSDVSIRTALEELPWSA